jgi:hypothetical protein
VALFRTEFEERHKLSNFREKESQLERRAPIIGADYREHPQDQAAPQ